MLSCGVYKNVVGVFYGADSGGKSVLDVMRGYNNPTRLLNIVRGRRDEGKATQRIDELV